MQAARPVEHSVALTLNSDEALVLFELLHRWEAESEEHQQITDKAEQRVLWDLSAVLEPVIHEAFASNYRELLDAARRRVRDPAG